MNGKPFKVPSRQFSEQERTKNYDGGSMMATKKRRKKLSPNAEYYDQFFSFEKMGLKELLNFVFSKDYREPQEASYSNELFSCLHKFQKLIIEDIVIHDEIEGIDMAGKAGVLYLRWFLET